MQKKAQWSRKHHQRESSASRQKRLEKNADHKAAVRLFKRRFKQSQCQDASRQQESPSQKGKRLQKQATLKEAQRQQESPSQPCKRWQESPSPRDKR